KHESQREGAPVANDLDELLPRLGHDASDRSRSSGGDTVVAAAARLLDDADEHVLEREPLLAGLDDADPAGLKRADGLPPARLDVVVDDHVKPGAEERDAPAPAL